MSDLFQRSGMVLEPVLMDGFRKSTKMVGEMDDDEPYRPFEVCF